MVAVSDWERSNSFYRDVLGAELVRARLRRWAYRFGEQQLNVHGPGSTPGSARADPGRPGQHRPLLPLGRNRRRRQSPTSTPTASTPELGPVPRQGAAGVGTSVYFRDPDGALLELISYG